MIKYYLISKPYIHTEIILLKFNLFLNVIKLKKWESHNLHKLLPHSKIHQLYNSTQKKLCSEEKEWINFPSFKAKKKLKLMQTKDKKMERIIQLILIIIFKRTVYTI
jgi:hypothetical protein